MESRTTFLEPQYRPSYQSSIRSWKEIKSFVATVSKAWMTRGWKKGVSAQEQYCEYWKNELSQSERKVPGRSKENVTETYKKRFKGNIGELEFLMIPHKFSAVENKNSLKIFPHLMKKSEKILRELLFRNITNKYLNTKRVINKNKKSLFRKENSYVF